MAEPALLFPHTQTLRDVCFPKASTAPRAPDLSNHSLTHRTFLTWSEQGLNSPWRLAKNMKPVLEPGVCWDSAFPTFMSWSNYTRLRVWVPGRVSCVIPTTRGWERFSFFDLTVHQSKLGDDGGRKPQIRRKRYFLYFGTLI